MRAAVALGPLVLLACAHGQSVAPNVRAQSAAFAIPRDSAGPVAWDPTQVQGRVLAVIFVATWCFPCLTELGVMEKLQGELGDKGLVTVAVGMDLEGHQVLDPFAAATGGKIALVVADEALRRGDSPFGPVRELPARFLFGRDGTLLKAWTGASDPARLRALIDEALARTPE
jgi:thiol-disulfide isomerase/thioredoxin